MAEDTIIYLKAFQAFHNGGLQDLLPDHSVATECMRTLMLKRNESANYNIVGTELVEALAFKFGSVSNSLENLLHGTLHGRYSETKYLAHDISTLYTLSRAQLEAYLIFYHLYISPKTKAEAELKYYVYVRHSLLLRQKAKAFSRESVAKKAREKEEIEDYKIKIQNNEAFKALTSTRQGILLSGNKAKGPSWEDLMEGCTMNTAILKKWYTIATNHAHSEYMSLIQVAAYAKNPDSAPWMLINIIKDSLMVQAVFLREIAQLTNMHLVYNAFPKELKIKLCLWYNSITELNALPDL